MPNPPISALDLSQCAKYDSLVTNEETDMGTIVARKRKDGSVGYMVRLRVMREGATYHETETFDRRRAAPVWMKGAMWSLSGPASRPQGIEAPP